MGPANLLAGRLVEVQDTTALLALDSANFSEQRLSGKLHQEISASEQDTLHLLCRPADVCLHTENLLDDHPNVLAGTVTYSSFVGGRWRTLVEVGQTEKQSLLAFADTPFPLHSTIQVELPPERCIIVRQ